MNKNVMMLTFVFLSCIVVCSAVDAQRPMVQRGVITQERIEAGAFQQYIPHKRTRKTNVLVICHGSIEDAQDLTALKSSRTFIERWIPFAEATGVALVAPAFDVENFASGGNAPGGDAWGYRALDGRTTSSDQFVNMIVDRFKSFDPNFDGKFYLYGHSAGGQFANHYLVVHPERLHGVVLSAPAIYAMPDPDTPWPAGMKARKRNLQWGSETKVFEISHKLETWVEAVKVPIAVVIGSADTDRLSDQPQQGGWTRLARAQHYASEMTRFAKENDVRPGIELIVVPNVGHSSSRLTNTCAQALLVMGNR
ncbi:alpha/beta hydrolase [Novipirellula maiorica]|uniref:alpha/beta hydrolase n=1 Tax=Novipirellula maiorica TaxID=1265734 RepID=UPI001360B5FD|nr:alpha/beta fold hydrolase [Rhodopirellula maiorica]